MIWTTKVDRVDRIRASHINDLQTWKVDNDGTAKPTFDRVRLTNVSHFNEFRAFTRPTQAIITFIFDDGPNSDFNTMLPVFQAQGEVACTAIPSSFVGLPGCLTIAQLQALQTAGWEILSHSVTHVDLTTLTEAEVEDEANLSRLALEGMGLTIENFVYPSHAQNAMVRRAVGKYYRSSRGGIQGLNPSVVRTYELASKLMDGGALGTFTALIDNAVLWKRWLIFYAHGLTTTVAMMNDVIDYAQGVGAEIMTVNQALDILGNKIDIGDNLFSVGPDQARIKHVHFSNYSSNQNVGLGYEALSSIEISTGIGNVGIGPYALSNLTTGSLLVAVGRYAGNTATNQTNCIYLGAYAGRWETGNSKLFIDSLSRINEADARIKALIYGIFDALTTNQYLRFNANVGIGAITFGANSDFVLGIANGTPPSAHVDDQVQVYSKDSSDAAATLGLELEQAIEAIGTFTPSHKIKIWINGTEYWLQLDAV